MKPKDKSVNTVNISFQTALLTMIDRAAKEEARSRSELIREAARSYIERKRRMQNLFDLGQHLTSTQGLTPQDVTDEIQAHRRGRKIKSKA